MDFSSFSFFFLSLFCGDNRHSLELNSQRLGTSTHVIQVKLWDTPRIHEPKMWLSCLKLPEMENFLHFANWKITMFKVCVELNGQFSMANC